MQGDARDYAGKDNADLYNVLFICSWTGRGSHPDVGVLVQLGQVEHVIQGQHPRGGLGEVHGGIYMVLQ